VPAKTPAAIVRRLNQEVVRVLSRPDIKEKYFNSGVETVGSTPEELAAYIKAEMMQMGKVITEVGLRAK
jgi:tripartite-type tricarboxylate transporter receptor subunit TctC